MKYLQFKIAIISFNSEFSKTWPDDTRTSWRKSLWPCPHPEKKPMPCGSRWISSSTAHCPRPLLPRPRSGEATGSIPAPGGRRTAPWRQRPRGRNRFGGRSWPNPVDSRPHQRTTTVWSGLCRTTSTIRRHRLQPTEWLLPSRPWT